MINEKIYKPHSKLEGTNKANSHLIGNIIFIILCLIVAFGIFSFFFSSGSKQPKIETKPKEELNTKIANKDFVKIDMIEPKEQESIAELNTTAPANATQKSSIKIIKKGAVMGRAANIEANAPYEPPQNSQANTQLAGQIKDEQKGEIFAPTAAYFSPFDQNLLLAKGTYIGCSLKTKLVSDIKGGIACVIGGNVYSNNGKTLLIEKGSVVTGTYSGSSIEEGHERIYVIWQEIRTPNNVVIPVFSGASDELGAAGIEGWVDNHYFRRFGSAILVSIIDQGVNALSTRLERKQNNDNSTTINSNAASKSSDLAKQTLEKMIHIKPTLYKNQGDIVGIYVNRDIDFRNVYKLRKR